MQIEGRNPVLEALKAKSGLTKIYLEDGIKKDEKISSIIKLARKSNIHINYIPKTRLNKKSKTQIHQGVIAFGESSQETTFPTLIKDHEAFLIYIREALYEHNLGAIIRTAECIGATGVVLPPKISISPQIRRAAMGATEHVPIVNYNLFQAIKEARKSGLLVAGIERDEKSVPLNEAGLTKPIMIIIGGEDRSLSKEILQKCDMIVEIPMKGKVNSLNMSVAAAIAMYEVERQALQSLAEKP